MGQIDRNSDGKISLYEYIAWVHKGLWTLIPNAKARRALVIGLIEEELEIMGKPLDDESFTEKVSVWTSEEYGKEVEAEVKALFEAQCTDQTDPGEKRETVKGVNMAAFATFKATETAHLKSKFEGKVWGGEFSAPQLKARFESIDPEGRGFITWEAYTKHIEERKAILQAHLASTNQPSNVTVQEAAGPPLEVHEVQMPDRNDMSKVIAEIETAYAEGQP